MSAQKRADQRAEGRGVHPDMSPPGQGVEGCNRQGDQPAVPDSSYSYLINLLEHSETYREGGYQLTLSIEEAKVQILAEPDPAIGT